MSPAPVSLAALRLRAAFALMLAAMLGALTVLSTGRAHRGLVLYASGDGAVRTAAAFTRATGVPVTVVRLFSGPMLARISAEGRRPGWSLAWFDGDMPAAVLDRAGLLARGVTPSARWTALGRALLPADGAWTPVATTLAGVDVRLAGGGTPPGDLGLADPAFSGPAYPQIAGMLSQAGGWPQGRAAVERLRNQGLSVAPTSPNVVTQLLDRRIGRALLQSNTAYLLADRNPAVRVVVAQPAFLLPNVIVQAPGLTPARRAEADRFVRFVLSDAAQSQRLRDGRVDAYAWPLTLTAAAPPAILPRLEALALVHLDPYRWGAAQATVTDWFESQVAQR